MKIVPDTNCNREICWRTSIAMRQPFNSRRPMRGFAVDLDADSEASLSGTGPKVSASHSGVFDPVAPQPQYANSDDQRPGCNSCCSAKAGFRARPWLRDATSMP